MLPEMFVELIGRIIAFTPVKVVEGMSYFLGGILSQLPRGKLVKKNMRMALDGFSEKELNRLSYEACERTLELGILGVAGQFFTKERWQKMITISPEVYNKIEELLKEKRGGLLLIPHTTLMEALTVLPAFVKLNRSVSILYRAFASPQIENLILKKREAYGVKLLNRSSGVRTLVKEIKAGQIGGLLFDQNSGERGKLISFMGRIVSASDLPDIVYEHTNAVPLILVIKRTGFWRGEIVIEKLQEGEDALPLTIQAHRWLEKYLHNLETAADWLWTHKRWKVLDRPRERLGFKNREIMDLPRQKKTKIFIRMPNWLGDVVMALPMLRALRNGRPDAEITFFSKQAYIPLLKRLGLADRCLSLPSGALRSFTYCSSLKKESPDATIALTNSLRGDIQMLMTGCKQRMGLKREGKWRPLINCSYNVSRAILEKTHQSHVWEEMFKNFGLTEKVSYEPVKLLSHPGDNKGAAPQTPGYTNEPDSEDKCVAAKELKSTEWTNKNLRKNSGSQGVASQSDSTTQREGDRGWANKGPIGFVPGSANTPEKRYPAELWRELAIRLNRPIVLFGAPGEQVITSQISKDLSLVTDLAGKTDMEGLAEQLTKCSVVIGNDTGAMHLANALGVPTIVLYGPTSPERTRPIFNAPYYQIKAANGEINLISVDAVYTMLKDNKYVG